MKRIKLEMDSADAAIVFGVLNDYAKRGPAPQDTPATIHARNVAAAAAHMIFGLLQVPAPDVAGELRRALRSMAPTGNITGALWGPHAARNRQHVVMIVTGMRPPLASCGYNAARAAVIAAAGIDTIGACTASVDAAIRDWIMVGA